MVIKMPARVLSDPVDLEEVGSCLPAENILLFHRRVT